MVDAVLIGGPQDGARVRVPEESPPGSVHVGPRWLGDHYAAWSREACARFPAWYDYYALPHAYRFVGWDKGAA